MPKLADVHKPLSRTASVLITIVSYNSVADIRECLTALAEADYPNYSICICENGGDAAFSSLCAARLSDIVKGKKLTLLKASSNLGYAGGINFLIGSMPRADLYWILNPDTMPFRSALSAMVSRLCEGDVGLVGNDIILPDGKLASRGGIWHPTLGRAESIDRGNSPNQGVPRNCVEARANYVIGASLLISSQCIQSIGLMRDDYFLYCEEVEWCIRARRMGWRIGYADDAKITHKHGTTTGGGSEIGARSRPAVYLSERARVLLTRDVYPTHLPVAIWFIACSAIWRYCRVRAWRQFGFAIQGIWAGILNERGKPAWMPDEAIRPSTAAPEN